MSKSDWINDDAMQLVLSLLMPDNALVMECCLVTGLRISDVLEIPASKFKQRMTITERKTGKKSRIYFPNDLYRRLKLNCGDVWLFASPLYPAKHRTRQAVWKDVKRACKALRIPDNVCPHSARKSFAVDLYRKKGLGAVQAALNHDSPTTTLIYIMSELLNDGCA